MIITKSLHRNIDLIMRLVLGFLCILIFSIFVYVCLTQDANSVKPKDIRGGQEHDEIFTVSETYLKENELSGSSISVEGQLSSVGGTLYLIDAVGDRKLQIPERVFELEKGSLSNLLILKGTYEISEEISVDNFLKDLEHIKPISKPLKK